MPFGYGLYTFLKANPVVVWIGGAFAAVVTFLSWQRLRDGRIRREERRRIEIKAEQAADKAVDNAKENAGDTIRKAEDARNRLPSGTPAGELPDDIKDILFDD